MKTQQQGRRTRHLPLVVVVAVCVVLVLGAWAWINVGQNDRIQSIVSASSARSGGTQGITWRKHDHIAYALSLEGLITPISGEAKNGVVAYHLDTTLCGRVLGESNGKTQVGMQLQNLVREHSGMQDARIQDAMGLPFVVLFDGGMPSSIRFPEGLNAIAQTELTEIIRTFQVKSPEKPSSRWSALEGHADGQYHASYQIDSEGTWSKKKIDYASVGPAAKELNINKIQVNHSLATFQPARSKSWWQEAEVEDEVLFFIAHSPFIRVKKHSTLKAITDRCDPNSDLANASNANDLLSIAARDEYKNVKPVAEARKAGPEDRERFRKLAEAFIESEAKSFADVHDLAAMLKEFPELSADIPELLSQDNLSELVSAGLVHALELAGNTESQKVLSDITSEAANLHSNRLRSIIGLSGVKNPSPESIDTLWQISGNRGWPEGENLANTALLALGNMSKNLREAGDESYNGISSRLGADLVGQNPETKVVLLAAMANSQDPDLLPYAAQELEALQPMVRAAAIEAISSVDTPESLDVIYARLKYEDNNRVRASLAEGIGRLSHKDDKVFEAFVKMVKTEQSKEVRGAVARYLADNIDLYPNSRKTLEGFLMDRNNRAQDRAHVTSKMRSRSSAMSGGRP